MPGLGTEQLGIGVIVGDIDTSGITVGIGGSDFVDPTTTDLG